MMEGSPVERETFCENETLDMHKHKALIKNKIIFFMTIPKDSIR